MSNSVSCGRRISPAVVVAATLTPAPSSWLAHRRGQLVLRGRVEPGLPDDHQHAGPAGLAGSPRSSATSGA